MDISKLSDLELYEKCREFGEVALRARREFMGLLPEVQRRELWRVKGFGSVFEFAAKLAGVSEEQVRNALNLDKKFEKLPVLRGQLVSGAVSLNKLIRVAAVANVENQDLWAARVQNLPQKALETLVRDEKVMAAGLELRAQLAIQEKYKFVKLPVEVADRLEKLEDMGFDLGQLIAELLDKREVEIEEEKFVLAAEQVAEVSVKNRAMKRPSRYIPMKIRRVLAKEHGGKCSISTCSKDSVAIHHTQRFALSGNHDPRFLAPLCEGHHQMAHAADMSVMRKRGVGVYRNL